MFKIVYTDYIDHAYVHYTIIEELKGKTTDVQNWKKMSYDIFMVGKINLNSLVKTELRYSNF